jgi:hypothetical protein
MSGPSNKAKREASKAPVFVPHPNDLADVHAAFEDIERGSVLSAEESEAYLRWLETGEGPCPVSRG